MTTRMRTNTVNGETEILVLVDHPMETGHRIDPRTRRKIPAHFIQKMTFSLNGQQFAVADLGLAVSRDPLVKVKVKAKPGDKVSVAWSDNKGETGAGEIAVS